MAYFLVRDTCIGHDSLNLLHLFKLDWSWSCVIKDVTNWVTAATGCLLSITKCLVALFILSSSNYGHLLNFWPLVALQGNVWVNKSLYCSYLCSFCVYQYQILMYFCKAEWLSDENMTTGSSNGHMTTKARQDDGAKHHNLQKMSSGCPDMWSLQRSILILLALSILAWYDNLKGFCFCCCCFF